MGLDVRVSGLEVLFDFFEVFLGGETVQDNIVIALGKSIGNTETDTA